MVGFRKHTLKAIIQTEGYEDPGTGDIIPGTETTIELPCRVSPAGKGEETRDQDGNSVSFSYLIHSNKNATKIPFGTMVSVFKDGQEIAKGKVINSFANGMNTRTWI